MLRQRSRQRYTVEWQEYQDKLKTWHELLESQVACDHVFMCMRAHMCGVLSGVP